LCYTYDGNNLRQSKTVTPAGGTAVTTKYIYDGTNLVAETVDENNYKGYMYAANTGGISIMVTPEGNYFLNNNILQDIEKVTNASGNTVQETGFDAFGNKYAIAGTELCPVGYRGEYHDAESGLIYLHNRYYDPEIGRFITEDPVKDGSNWYVYCGNNPIMFVDPLGLDAIIITADHAAIGFGHTSALYQNADGDWFYTYWGDKAAAVIRIPDTYIKEYRRNCDVTANSMASLSDFNNALSEILANNGFENITKNYTHATYIVGDFTKSLDAAYADVDKAYKNKCSKGTLTILDDGSKVFQGHNSPYNLAYRNCFDKTYASLSKGTLADGTNVGTYMKTFGFKGGMIPNIVVSKFSDVFMNTFFTYDEAYNLLDTYATLYKQGSHLTNKTKGSYATAVASK